MAVRPRGKAWQVDLMIKGRRIRESFVTKAEAEAYELSCRAAHTLGKPIPRPREGSSKAVRAATLGGLFDYVTEHHWKGKKAEGMLSLNARQFVDHVGRNVAAVDALRPDVVDAYVRWRETEKHNSDATINRHLSSISVLIRNAVRLGYLAAPFELKWRRESQGRLRYYTEQEERALVSTLETWGYTKEALLIHFLADTGARLGEARKIQWRDIDGRSLTFVDTKNGSNRTVIATPRVLQALQALRETEGGKAGPFTWVNRHSLYKLWQRVVGHVGITDSVTIHTWRHTCASRLVQRGVDLYRVQRWMGHKNVVTTQRYAHLSPTHMEELADVLGSPVSVTRAGVAERQTQQV